MVEKVKYQRSALEAGQVQVIHQALMRLMDQHHLYKNPELTLADVAEKLSVHPNVLSQVINARERKSFFDYINYLRVAAFKKLAALPESRKYTLLSMAFECGFNSKTSFNRNFKKITGVAPSDYLKRLADPQTR